MPLQNPILKTLPPYPAYKESGEPWLGEIPEGWELRKMKHLFREKKITHNADLECGSISFGEVVFKGDEKVTEATKASYQEVLSGEFLINPLNLNYDLRSLRIGLSRINVVVSSGYIVLQNRCILNKEYYRWLLHRYDVAFMKLLGSGVRQTISFNHIANSLLAFPTPSEQTAIADFLDDKTAMIDKAIAQKERLIALLKERKQIIIQNAVTKGLDPNVKMKDSGIEWIGEIPEHWEKTSIRYLLEKLEQGDSPTASNDSDSTYVLKLSAVKNGTFSSDETKPILKSSYQERFQIRQNDFLLTRGNTPELVGDTCLVDRAVNSQIMFSDLIYRLSFKSELVDLRYILAIFQSGYMRKQISSSAVGSSSSMVKVSQGDIKSWFVFMPPKKDQELTAQSLSEDFTKIDKAVSEAFRGIQKLREYRATLIDSAVTGKIKVPGI